ncbi:MutS protein msh5 [Phlyctochytrium planicorne]|nr:MutS protein msh5 [Phlyctochytrium planicorne]
MRIKNEEGQPFIKRRNSTPTRSFGVSGEYSQISPASARRRLAGIKPESFEDDVSMSGPPSTSLSGVNVMDEFLHQRSKKIRRDEDTWTNGMSKTDETAAEQEEIDEESKVWKCCMHYHSSDNIKVILALSIRRGRLGAAHFTPANGTLFLLEDINEGTERFELARILIFQAQPQIVLCHARVDETFLAVVRECVNSLPTQGIKRSVEIRPSTEFLYKTGLSRLLSLDVLKPEKEEPRNILDPMSVDLRAEGENSHKGLSARVLIESIVSLDNSEMVGSAGSLLAYMTRNRIIRELEGVHEQYNIRIIEKYSLTLTPMGAIMLKNWFLRPSIDLRVINGRLDTISFFLKPSNQALVGDLRTSLQNVKNIPILRDFHESGLREVGSLINNIVDFPESLKEDRVVVRNGVDNSLDEFKRMYHGLDDLLSIAAREISQIVPTEYSRALNVIYFPQLGFLITLPFDENMDESEDFDYPGLEFQFCTETTVFFKSEEMREMDSTIGDIHTMIVDKEIEIVQRLKDAVQTFSPFLTKLVDLCSELDCILSLSEVARDKNYVRPRVDPRNILQISKGRHPLQELTVDTFIENPAEFGQGTHGALNPTGENKRIMLITGPNASGKSVYLKQIGIIVFMAHIGSFVPAESAVIGLTDCILTRIQTAESVSKVQSAFMIDTQQISHALKMCTSRSLILIDEYGKGTSITDGMALFCAVMNYFIEKGDHSPFVLATTHFHEILHLELIKQTEHLLECRMDIAEAEGAEEDFAKAITFLYKQVSFCGTLTNPILEFNQGGRFPKDLVDLITEGKPITHRVMQTEEDQWRATEEILDYFSNFDCENGDLSELISFLNPFKGIF